MPSLVMGALWSLKVDRGLCQKSKLEDLGLAWRMAKGCNCSWIWIVEAVTMQPSAHGTAQDLALIN